MPVSKLSDLPVGGGGRWPLCGQGGFRSAHWGDLEIGYTVLDAPDRIERAISRQVESSAEVR